MIFEEFDLDKDSETESETDENVFQTSSKGCLDSLRNALNGIVGTYVIMYCDRYFCIGD